MKRRAFAQNKLWRDLAVDLLEAQGSLIHWQRLNDEDFLQQLSLKLVEEAKEVAAAKCDEELCAEIADVLEVIDSLCTHRNLSLEKIQAVQREKQLKRGSFTGRRYVTVAEHFENSFGEKYCLADPEKYPEISVN